VSIATESKLATLETAMKALQNRVQRLEGAQGLVSAARPSRDKAALLAETARLRVAIENIFREHPEYSAKYVLKLLAAVDLGRHTLPTVRTVQLYLKALRNE
jgi:hypothetical protein